VTDIPEGLPLGLQQRQPELHHAVWRRLTPQLRCWLQKGRTSGGTSNKINEWFNTACFVSPADFTFGNESRTDANLRGSGVNNFDFALFKRTSLVPITGWTGVRTELLNLFNRTQFAPAQHQRWIRKLWQGNQHGCGYNPRLIQFGLKFIF